MHVAGIMSEQQSILSALRALPRAEGVLESSHFHELVGRIQSVQRGKMARRHVQEQRDMSLREREAQRIRAQKAIAERRLGAARTTSS